jgi:NAD(P)-dependent dehydrogenase (short-subunit alcohol dehydrogenase family)
MSEEIALTVGGVPNRRVIVTGVGSGIGRATALVLAERGYDIGMTYGTNADGAARTAEAVKKLGRRAFVERMQLEEPDSIFHAIETLCDQLGGLEALVNNAGLLDFQSFLELDLKRWRHIIDCNLTGTFLSAQAAARRMIANSTPGRIVNVSSVHEIVPLMDATAYCCSKAGIGMLTKCMALELAPYGITVTAIAPGETATAMSGSPDETVTGKERPWIPVGRPGKSREMALTVAHLIDPEAAYTTGTTIVVDGGLLLMAAIPNQKAKIASSQP